MLPSSFYIVCILSNILTSSWCTAGGDGAEETFEQMAGAVCKEVYGETLRGTIMACQRYKDELLEACLELLLSAPTAILSTQASSCALCVKTGSTIAISLFF